MMSNSEDLATDVIRPDEKSILMSRARMMGMTVSNNIGLDTLRERINAQQELIENSEAVSQDDDNDEEIQENLGVNPLAQNLTASGRKMTLRQQQMAEQMKLVRVRITCMDPKKKDLPGEIFTVANEYIGTVRKFVPFGDQTENGWHLPFCIYTMLKDRKFLNIRTIKDNRTGQVRVETNYAREFALDVMEPLTKDEIRQLGIAQIAQGTSEVGSAENL